jgi:hypothetical protein
MSLAFVPARRRVRSTQRDGAVRHACSLSGVDEVSVSHSHQSRRGLDLNPFMKFSWSLNDILK